MSRGSAPSCRRRGIDGRCFARTRKAPAAIAVGLILLVGCTMPEPLVDPSGTIEILGPVPGFSPDRPPEDWLIVGNTHGRVDVDSLDGVPALNIRPGAGPFLLARRTRAVLLVSPYLSWTWNMKPQTRGLHPVALIVGFRGGNRKNGGWARNHRVSLPAALPSHDRALVLTWAGSALQRGSMLPETSLSVAGMTSAPRYVVRGGRENAGIWWLDTVDLSALYVDAWPEDDVGRVEVVFVAVAATSQARVGARVAGIMLTR
jgi:hypothetical protein